MKIYLIEFLGLCIALLIFGFLLFSNMPRDHFEENKVERASLRIHASP